MKIKFKWFVIPVLFVLMSGCKEDGNKAEDIPTCDLQDPECDEGLVCEEVQDGEPQCVSPVIIHGVVQNNVDESPVDGALIQAVDGNGAAIGITATSSADGTFDITVPAARDAEGTPLESIYTLKAQAAGYQKFPTAIRQALPIDVVAAGQEEPPISRPGSARQYVATCPANYRNPPRRSSPA